MRVDSGAGSKIMRTQILDIIGAQGNGVGLSEHYQNALTDMDFSYRTIP